MTSHADISTSMETPIEVSIQLGMPGSYRYIGIVEYVGVPPVRDDIIEVDGKSYLVIERAWVHTPQEDGTTKVVLQVVVGNYRSIFHVGRTS